MAAKQLEITQGAHLCDLPPFSADSTALKGGLTSFLLLGTPKRRQRNQQEVQPTSEDLSLIYSLIYAFPVQGVPTEPGAGQALGAQWSTKRV